LFPIREGLNLEFRAEAFNIFNTVIYGQPNNDMADTANFGRVLNTANSARQLRSWAPRSSGERRTGNSLACPWRMDHTLSNQHIDGHPAQIFHQNIRSQRRQLLPRRDPRIYGDLRLW